jgi:hypothetical protein
MIKDDNEKFTQKPPFQEIITAKMYRKHCKGYASDFTQENIAEITGMLWSYSHQIGKNFDSGEVRPGTPRRWAKLSRWQTP